MTLRIASYNVEWFAGLFGRDDELIRDNSWSPRHNVTKSRQAEAIADVIRAVDPDILLIVEGPDHGPYNRTARALETFARAFDLRQSAALHGFPNGTRQELALMFDPTRLAARHMPVGTPFKPQPEDGAAASGGQGRMRLDALDPDQHAPRFDSILPLDIDNDGWVDLHRFSKPPLEAEVTVGADTLRLVGVHAKSKAPHGARDEAEAVAMQIANRRKQLAQCEWIRRRVDHHLDAGEPVIVLGDFNDGPGIDKYERLFGRSGVELVMGPAGAPARQLRNPFVAERLSPGFGPRPASARFYIHQEERWLNALIDFVMISPDLAPAASDWRIWHPFDDKACFADAHLREALLNASDHFPVTVDLDI